MTTQRSNKIVASKKIDPQTFLSIQRESLQNQANISKSEHIPLIDAQPLIAYGLNRTKTPSWQSALALLEHALSEVGFFSLKHHGLDASSAKKVSQSFFNLNIEQKKTYLQTPEFQFGYTCEGSEKLFLTEEKTSTASSFNMTHGDPKEAYNVAPLHLSYDWPKSDAQFNGDTFQKYMTQYYKQCAEFTAAFLPNIAIILGESSDFFNDKMHEHMSVVRTLHYPACHQSNNDQLRASAHCDFGLLTLLQTFGVAGLQVENKLGHWIDVVLEEKEHLVVNIGDTLSRMTNGTFRSTRHRVAPTISARRQSIPYFVNFPENALIEPVKKFKKLNGNYPPISSGDYIYYKNSLAMGFKTLQTFPVAEPQT